MQDKANRPDRPDEAELLCMSMDEVFETVKHELWWLRRGGLGDTAWAHTLRVLRAYVWESKRDPGFDARDSTPIVS
jgi:hypothetical protein